MRYERDKYIFLANLYKKAGRFSDMYIKIKELLLRETKITEEMGELIDICYKNILNPLRINIRKMNFLLEGNLSDSKRRLVEQMLHEMLHEYTGYLEIKNNIELKLEKIPILNNEYTILFLHKLRADFFRYAAENTLGDIKKNNLQNALESYKEAYNYSKEKLNPGHYLRLGIVLNYTVFLYEYLNKKKHALKILNNFFDESLNFIEVNNINLKSKSQKVFEIIQKNIIYYRKKNEREQY